MVKTVVRLVPVRTDSALFQDWLSADADIYLLRGRVRCLDTRGGAQLTPFSLMILTLCIVDHSFDDDRWRHATRGAHRDQTISLLLPFQFIDDGADQDRTGGTDRMTERNRTAVHVQLLRMHVRQRALADLSDASRRPDRVDDVGGRLVRQEASTRTPLPASAPASANGSTLGEMPMPTIAISHGSSAPSPIRGIIEGDSDPDVFIPELIAHHVAGRFPFDRLIATYPFADMNQAIEDQHGGRCTKAVLIM